MVLTTPGSRQKLAHTEAVSILVKLGKAAVVAVAFLLVLSGLSYGWVSGRSDVTAVIVGELIVVGSLLAGLRAWRTRPHP